MVIKIFPVVSMKKDCIFDWKIKEEIQAGIFFGFDSLTDND